MNNIVLMGFMGTGKTKWGRAVAEHAGMEFLDMDDMIEERAGRKISDIFADDGEAVFRQMERDLVTELSARDGLVIACGGGVVINPDNIADYSSTGTVVCLVADPEIILERVSQTAHRPLLEDGDKAQKILDLLESRKELYGSIPKQVDTGALDDDKVVGAIMAQLD